jgi:hypothetical protein
MISDMDHFLRGQKAERKVDRLVALEEWEDDLDCFRPAMNR